MRSLQTKRRIRSNAALQSIKDCNNRQLLDEVFMRIQNNQGRGRNYQPKPKADKSYRDLDFSGYHKKPTLIIFFILHWTKNEKIHVFCFFTDGKQHKARELDMITLRNHAPLSYMTSLHVTLSILDMMIEKYLQLDDVTGADFENSPYAFGQSERR